MQAPANFMGLQIVLSPNALEQKTTFVVQRIAIPKRRNRWIVKRVQVTRPGCYRFDGKVFMHPELFALMQGAADA